MKRPLTAIKQTKCPEANVVSDDEFDSEPLNYRKDWWPEIKATWSFETSADFIPSISFHSSDETSKKRRKKVGADSDKGRGGEQTKRVIQEKAMKE